VSRPENYPRPLSQAWCVGWCSLSPDCKSAAYKPVYRLCRFSEYSAKDSNFIEGPDVHKDTEGVYYWHDMSCFNCPCNDGDETVEEPVATTTTGPMPEPETTTQSGQPTSEPSGAVRFPAASTCPKALKEGCHWNEASRGGSAPRGAGYTVQEPRDQRLSYGSKSVVVCGMVFPRPRLQGYRTYTRRSTMSLLKLFTS
jgi:hypothetical protein